MKKIIIISILVTVLFISCEKDVYITPPPEEPANGFVFINSNPTGATIFINDKNTGKVTPDSLTYLEFGSTKLTLKKEGFYDTVFTATLSKDVKNQIFIDFTKNPRMMGSINFTSLPTGAEIFINDSLIGKTTPYKLSGIIPGIYKVRNRKTGYRDAESFVKVTSGTTVASYLTLQDTTKWVDYKTSNSGLVANETTCLEVDNQNKIWIGTENKGLIVYDGINWINYSTENSLLPSNKILAIAKDNLGNILIGTDKGLAKYVNGSFEIYNVTNSNLPNNYIADIAVYNNEIWLATKSGLANFKQGSFVVYNSSNSQLPENYITAVGFDKLGVLYIGTYASGIVKMDGNNFTIYNSQNNKLPGNSITCINCDSQGRMWFGHLPTSNETGGLSCYNGNSFIVIGGLTVNKINDIFSDSYGLTWASTDYGIVTLDASFNKTFLMVQNTGLTSNFVRNIKQDKNRNIWIATYGGGVCKYKKY